MSGTFNINQINVNVTDVIPPDNFATVDAGNKVGTVYTKAQDNEWRAEVEQNVTSGIKGVAKPDDTVPATGFFRMLADTATIYTNYIGENDAPIEVTDADLNIVNGVQRNEVIFEVTDGVTEKKVFAKVGADGANGTATIPKWVAGDYAPDAMVVDDFVQYMAPDGADATDIPGVSDKWVSVGNKVEVVNEIESQNLDNAVTGKAVSEFTGILDPIIGIPPLSFGKIGQNVIAQVNGLDWLYTKDSSGWKKIYQLTQLGGGIFTTKKGLIINEDFSNDSNYTLPDTYDNIASPSYISWGKIGEKIGQKSTNDAMGRREGHLFIDDDGKWYLYYGSSANTSSGWRIQLDVSLDKGLTWQKKGDTSIGLSNGVGGSFPARDMLFMAKFEGVYYMFAMTAAGSGSSVPVGPYYSDVWKYEGDNLENANWQYVRYQLTAGATAYTQGGAYMGSIVKDLSTDNYKVFFSGNRTIDTYNIWFGTSNAPDGAVSILAQPILPEVQNFIIENPKVFYSNHFQKWVMINNSGNKLEDKTSQNLLLFSDNLDNWSYSNGVNTSYTSVLDGEVAVGIHSPFYLAEGLTKQTSDGRVPMTFDSLNTSDAVGSIGKHTNRNLYYTVFEPSNYAVKRNISSIYYDDFNSVLNTTQLLTAYNNSWSLAFGNNNFNVGAQNSQNDSSVIASTGTRSVLLYNHLFNSTDTKSVILNIGCDFNSSGGLVFNYVNNNNYDFVFISYSVGGVYSVVNGVQTKTVDFNAQGTTTLQNVTLSITDGKWWINMIRKNEIILEELKNVINGSKCGVLADSGTTYLHSFEIINESIINNSIIETPGSFQPYDYNLQNAINGQSLSTFNSFLKHIRGGAVTMFNDGNTSGIGFKTAGEKAFIIDTPIEELTFEMSVVSGSVGIIYNYVDFNNFYLLDISYDSLSTVFYRCVAGVFTQLYFLPISANNAIFKINSTGQIFKNNVNVGTLHQFDSNNKYFGFRNGAGIDNVITSLKTIQQEIIIDGFLKTGQRINFQNQNIANGVFEFSAYNPKKDATPLEFKFRVLNEDNYYFVAFAPYSHFIIGKKVDGVKTILTNYSSVDYLITGNNPLRLKIVLNDNLIQAYCNGTKIEITDSTFESGYFGFNVYYSWNELRNFRFYKSSKIGIIGTSNGQNIVLRSAGVPVYKGVTSADFTEVEVSHFPIDEITINGIEKEFKNLLWGGDIVNYNP